MEWGGGQSLVKGLTTVVVMILAAACASGPGPGQSGYPYNVDGRYSGRLMVEGEPFDATFDLATGRSGRVRGSFIVRAPLEIQGDIDGRVVDDLLRVTLIYANTGPDGRQTCEGVVEGVLTVSPGGGIVDGPVTITDCGDALPGRMSFRRAPVGS